jgi:GPH family glycoside/pentoside/hexuronide:cation symporter
MSDALPLDDVAPPPPPPRGTPHGTRLSLDQMLTYAAPSVGMHFTFLLMGLYFFKFATDTLLVAPAMLGTLVGVSRLWDAISDPLAGYLSDRTRTRFGRRRPWMALAALPFGISMVMLWSPPSGLGDIAVVAWVGVGLLLFYTTYTALLVPYDALGAELSQDYHDRTRLFAYRQGVGALGLMLGVGAFYLLLQSEAPETATWGLSSRDIGQGVAIASLLLVCGTVAVLVLRVRERPDYRDRGPARVFGAFGDVARNPHARRLLGVQGLHFFSVVTLSLVSAFMFQHVMQIPSWLTAVFVACFVLGSVGAIPAWVRLSERFGKDRCWRPSLVIMGAIYTSIFFGLRHGLSQDLLSIAVAGLASACLGGATSGNFVLSRSMQADVIDYDEHETGERKEGAYLATWSFVEKCAGALAAVLIGAALQLVGYEPGAAQSDATRLTILALMSLVPAACYFGAAWLLRGFALDEAAHARIRSALDARGRSGEAP